MVTKKVPKTVSTIEKRHIIYNEQIDYIRANHKDVEIIELNPTEAFETTRLTKNKDILEKDYLIGYRAGERLIHQLS